MAVEHCHFLEDTADVMTAVETDAGHLLAVEAEHRISLAFSEMGSASFHLQQLAVSAAAVGHVVRGDDLRVVRNAHDLRQAAVAEAVVALISGLVALR